ncbi:MAG: hypothetical protein AAAB35_15805 [Phyllobacterium sp.]
MQKAYDEYNEKRTAPNLRTSFIYGGLFFIGVALAIAIVYLL